MRATSLTHTSRFKLFPRRLPRPLNPFRLTPLPCGDSDWCHSAMLEMAVIKAATDRVIPLTRLASVLKHAQSVQELTITWRRIRALQSALAEEVANELVELRGTADEENSSPAGVQSKEIVDLVEGLLKMAVEEQQQRSNTMHTKRLVERALVVNRPPVVLCPASQRLDSATRYFFEKSFNFRGMVGSIRPQYVPGGFDYGGRYGQIAEVNPPQPTLPHIRGIFWWLSPFFYL